MNVIFLLPKIIINGPSTGSSYFNLLMLVEFARSIRLSFIFHHDHKLQKCFV